SGQNPPKQAPKLTPPPQEPSLRQEQTESANVEDDPSSSGVSTASGRTQIWAAGWKFIKLSPMLGYGFHADRLVLGTHMHNAVLHAMIQTGLLGTIPFVGAILWAWFLLIKTLRKIDRLAPMHKTAVIQSAGILVFLSFRSLPESTGAFFGIDWLLLSPLLLYLRLVNSADATKDEGA
ncbi:MAG: O-antigen ligase family protein, partial [Chloroflexi bacterium]|nr:O-antigen ligase family protein [Chloroflexota bacterium]